MAYKIPYTFIPGTKAKANEVNSNFSKVTEYFTELNASLNETTSNLNSAKTDLDKTKILFQEGRTKFCVNSSTGTIITTSETNLYFNSSFVITNSKGITATISSVQPINCQTFNDGTYNFFVGVDSTIEYFNNTIYKQKAEPTTKNINDIWLNTSKEPIFAGKWNGTTWQEYLKVPIGNAVIKDKAIKSVNVFPFNQNGYNVNQLSSAVTELTELSTTGKSVITNYILPDYANGVTKLSDTVYKAESDGWIHYRGCTLVNNPSKLHMGMTSDLGIVVMEASAPAQSTGYYVPIAKDMYYKCTGGTFIELIFYPMKGTK